MSISDLNLSTGDLLLFSYDNPNDWFFNKFTNMIKWGTHSNYSHVAMILKDPSFISPNLKGTYVWESSYEHDPDPQDGKIKLGVQIAPLAEILEDYKDKGKVFYRKLEGVEKTTFQNEKLQEIHKVVYGKPYDLIPTDWIGALFKKDAEPQKTSRFWCSALVGYIYTKLNVLKSDTDWSILTPNDFSLSGENLAFEKSYHFTDSVKQIQ